MITFFNKAEIQTLSKVAGKPYRKKNQRHIKIGRIAKTVVEKTTFWAESIDLKGYIAEPSRKWQINGVFASYSWARIYKQKDTGKGVYFTVGVDFRYQALIYKLDCQKKNSSEKVKLSKTQIQRFKEFVEPSDAQWQEIPLSEFRNWNWEKLVKVTEEFIKTHDHLYDEAMRRLYGKDTFTRIARICWNTNGWVKPSGREGKATSKSYEKKYGFGYEEWLFDMEKMDGGFQYGFLEPISKYQNKYSGQTFNIRLFTIDGTSQKWYWVGELKNVIVIDQIEAKRVLNKLRRVKKFEKMKRDLENVQLNKKNITKALKYSEIINIKFKPDAMSGIFSDLVELTDKEKELIGNRYNLMYHNGVVWENDLFENRIGKFSFNGGLKTPDDRSEQYQKTSVADTVELQYLHAPLLNSLLDHLKNTYGRNCVRRECPAYGRTKVDIVRKTNSGNIFYEIKTYSDARSCLRVALGQTLEYAFYAGQENCKEIIVVSETILKESDKKYLDKLNEKISTPIRYMQFNVQLKKPIAVYPN